MNDATSRAPIRLGVPIPYLRVEAADTAIAFYCAVFDASVVVRLAEPGGRVAHAELRLGPDGDGSLMLSDEYPEFGLRGPANGVAPAVALQLYVANVDSTFARAAAHGGRATKAPTLDPFGDRAGKLVDPCGHEGIVATRIQKLTPSEMSLRFAAIFEERRK